MSMNEVWNKVSKKQREQLLEVRGLHKSFAKVSNFNDLPDRDGGHVKRDLNNLYREYEKRKRR